METNNTIKNNDFLLVSDSNESNPQYDSRHLTQENLADIAFDNLAKKHLGFLSNYLTNVQFNNTKMMLEDKLRTQRQIFDLIPREWNGKFTAVDGQVILLEPDNIPEGMTALEYLKSKWSIPSNYQIEELKGCMLRGVSQIEDWGIQGTDAETVSLQERHIPRHMHQSAITDGARVEITKTNENNVADANGLYYNMFNDDSESTGVDNNDIDGVHLEFETEKTGTQGLVTHTNIPHYHKFIGFIVSKPETAVGSNGNKTTGNPDDYQDLDA